MLFVAAPARGFVFADSSGADESRWQTTSAGSTGSAGDPITLTWSFVPDGTQVQLPDSSGTLASDLIADFDAEFGAGPGGSDLTQRPWFTIFQQSFERIGDLAGVTYVYEPNDNSSPVHGLGAGINGVRGDVRIGGIGMDGIGGTLAYDYFPDGGGDMAIDTDDLADLLGNSANNHRGLRNAIMHEALHGLGLDHTNSSNSNILLEPAISLSFDGPQHDDLRGLHTMYGDAFEKGGRNDSVGNATDLFTLSAGSSKVVGAGGNGTTVAAGETDFVSISNQHDVDYFSFTLDATLSVDLTMTPRGASYLQDPTQFDTTTTNNLSLTLFDSNGVTPLSESSAGAAGVVEQISAVVLDPGSYYARVEGPSVVDVVAQFYKLELTATSIVTPELLGDFTGDGLVDAADYSLWRTVNGSSVTPFTGADHTGDGVVNTADYNVWAQNYGATLGGSSALAVPEPSALLLVGALGALSWRPNRLDR